MGTTLRTAFANYDKATTIMDLHGGCACGRNVYVVEIPEASSEESQIVFDTSPATRRHHASPFVIFLSVPVSFFHSATLAFYPDETHRSIRRTFASPFDSSLQRQFCGYCGTQLSQWSDDADDGSIQITLGSLFERDLELLEDAGLLDFDKEDEVEETGGAEGEAMDIMRRITFAPVSTARHRVAPWYESLVENTALGRVKRQKGGHTSADGSYEYEWEITEYTEEGDDENEGDVTPVKRKIGEVEEPEDQEMRA